MIGSVLALAVGFSLQNTYPRAMEIVEVKEDTAICVDAVGFEWEFDGADDLDVGDIIICTMYDKGTKNTIIDDEIIDVRWSGYTTESVKAFFNTVNTVDI